MVDVDQRITTVNPAHLAGLRRLSARAATLPPSPSTPLPPRNALLSLSSFAHNLITNLLTSGTTILPGLSDPEFSRVESQFGFIFPPDLKAILRVGLPVGPGFPDWRSPRARPHIRALIDLPIAAISLQIAKNSLWFKSWGPRPADPERIIRVARIALKRAPILIPIFTHCYIPCSPCLAGNPIFHVDENRIFCCALDLADFFETRSDPDTLSISGFSSSSSSSTPSISNFSRRSRSLDSSTRTPRRVEFWSDAAMEHRKRNSHSSTASFRESLFEMPRSGIPRWVEDYIHKIGSVLRGSGWAESDVSEIVHVSASRFFEDGDIVLVDNQTVLDALLVKADLLSDLLRKSGWSSEEVTDVFSFDFRVPKKDKKPVKKLSSKFLERIWKLTE